MEEEERVLLASGEADGGRIGDKLARSAAVDRVIGLPATFAAG